MTRTVSRDRTSPVLFALIAVVVYAVALPIAARLPGLEDPRTVAIGMMLDMIVVVPLAYTLLVVRRFGAPAVTIIPVLVLSVLAASRVLPPDHHAPLRVVELLIVPIELGLLVWIAWRAVRAVRVARRGGFGDPLDHLQDAAFELTDHHRVAAILASEIGLFYYALGAWRARPDVPPGTSAFTQHRETGHGGVVFAFLFLLAVEGLVVHVFIQRWSEPLAWIATIGTIYAALWLIADYRATVLRPILVDAREVTFRAGLRYTLRVPRSQIAAVVSEDLGPGEEHIQLPLVGAPTVWVTLTESAVAKGPYGMSRRTRAIGVHPDAARELAAALISGPERDDDGEPPERGE